MDKHVKQVINHAIDAGYEIVALVESENDIPFWQWAFQKFIPGCNVFCTSKIHNITPDSKFKKLFVNSNITASVI